MQCVKRSLCVFVALVALFTFSPKVSFASTSTCECFCGSQGSGSVDADAMSREQCQQTCADTNTQFVGCFTDQQFYPTENPKCWTEEQCKAWTGNSHGSTIHATWDASEGMPYDCTKTKTGLKEQKYCYADEAPYTLNVPIGSITEIENLPTYINIVYTWLLPAAALIAVVMMMLGGLQYVLSRGKSKYIEKAKTRITNAITGVVILLSIFVILNLIDPRLTVFNALKVPMIREVTLLDAASSCEALHDEAGYGVTTNNPPGTTVCGGTATITDSGHLKDGVLGSWKDGDVCNYTYCDDGRSCVSVKGEKMCTSCFDIPSSLASDSVCGAMQEFDGGSNGEHQTYCEYDATIQSCITAGTGLGSLSSDYQGFNCSGLRTKAAESRDGSDTMVGCDVYDDLQFGYSGTTASIMSEKAATLLEEICNQDKCSIGSDVLTSDPDAPVRCEYKSAEFGCEPAI